MVHALQFIVILVFVVIVLGTLIAFMIGLARAMREEAKNRHSRVRPALTWTVIGAGCLALIGAIVASLGTWHFTRIATRTTGTVIEMVARTDDDNSKGITYSPTFRYQDTHGEQHTVISYFSSSPPEFHVGESVQVLYVPDDPEGARIDTFWRVWGLPTLLGIASGVGLPIGLGMLFWPALAARLRMLNPPDKTP